MASPSTRGRLQAETQLRKENQRLGNAMQQQSAQMEEQSQQIKLLMEQLAAMKAAKADAASAEPASAAASAPDGQAAAEAAAAAAREQAAPAATDVAEAAAPALAAGAEAARAAAPAAPRFTPEELSDAAEHVRRRRSLGAKAADAQPRAGAVVRSAAVARQSKSTVIPPPDRWDLQGVREHIRKYRGNNFVYRPGTSSSFLAPMVDFAWTGTQSKPTQEHSDEPTVNVVIACPSTPG
jgi:hypothetical protein